MGLNPVAQPLDTTHLEEHLRLKRGLVLAALSGAAHAYMGHYFSLLLPVGGFCYGATFALSAWAVNAIFRIANIDRNTSPIVPLIKLYACIFISFAVGSFVTTAAGFPINYTLGMALSMLTVATVVKIALITALIAFAAIATTASIALIHRMRRDHVPARQAIEGLYQDIRQYIPDPLERPIANAYRGLMELLNRRRIEIQFHNPDRHGPFEPEFPRPLLLAQNFNAERLGPLPPQPPEPERPRHLRAFQRFHEIEDERQQMLRRLNLA